MTTDERDILYQLYPNDYIMVSDTEETVDNIIERLTKEGFKLDLSLSQQLHALAYNIPGTTFLFVIKVIKKPMSKTGNSYTGDVVTRLIVPQPLQYILDTYVLSSRQIRPDTSRNKAKMLESSWKQSIKGSKRTERYGKRIKSYKQLNSRFYQSAISKYTLSEAAQYMAALFFDLRSIHFLTTGNEFYTYHKLAEELYEKTEDYYDDLIETAIGYDSDISAMYVLPGDWDSVNTDGSFNSTAQVPQTLILDRLEKIYDVLESVKDYDSMVKSKIDAMLEYYDKEIYKLKQALK